MIPSDFGIGDRVKVYLASTGNWFAGTISSIEPYSQHRVFHWVRLDPEAQSRMGVDLISVLNPKNIQKIPADNDGK